MDELDGTAEMVRSIEQDPNATERERAFAQHMRVIIYHLRETMERQG